MKQNNQNGEMMGSSLIGPPHQNDDDIDFPEDLF